MLHTEIQILHSGLFEKITRHHRMFTDSKLSVPYSVKAVMKNKKIKNHKNPDDSAATRHLSWLSSCLPGLEIIYSFKHS
jgi:hypothetical protein